MTLYGFFFFFLLGRLENSLGKFGLNDSISLCFEIFLSPTWIPQRHEKNQDAAGTGITRQESQQTSTRGGCWGRPQPSGRPVPSLLSLPLFPLLRQYFLSFSFHSLLSMPLVTCQWQLFSPSRDNSKDKMPWFSGRASVALPGRRGGDSGAHSNLRSLGAIPVWKDFAEGVLKETPFWKTSRAQGI